MSERSDYYRNLLEHRLKQLVEAHALYLNHNGGDYDFDMRKLAPAFDMFAKLVEFDGGELRDPSAEECLELTYESLKSAELFFNCYTVYSGQNRLVPFVIDTVSGIIGAKDDVARELGDPDAPDPIYDDLGDTERCIEGALAHYNRWVKLEGCSIEDPQVAVMNSYLVYALEHARALIARDPNRVRSQEGPSGQPERGPR